MLSDTEIRAELGKDVVIHPFVESQLKPNSYDIKLGEYFYVERRHEGAPVDYNIYSEASVNETWELVRAPICDQGELKGRRVLWLSPGEHALGHSEEFVGGRGRVTTKIQTRSSIGRSGMDTCRCAGSGDIGFINRWTFELSNKHHSHRVPFVCGEAVSQILFFRTGACTKPYVGKYQPSDSLTSLIMSWKPEMMLPRLFVDAREWISDADFTKLPTSDRASASTAEATESKGTERTSAELPVAETVVLHRQKSPDAHVVECRKCGSLLCIDTRNVRSVCSPGHIDRATPVYTAQTTGNDSLTITGDVAWWTNTAADSYVFYCPVCKEEVTQKMRQYADDKNFTEFCCKRSFALTNLFFAM